MKRFEGNDISNLERKDITREVEVDHVLSQLAQSSDHPNEEIVGRERVPWPITSGQSCSMECNVLRDLPPPQFY
jgi:hypothetical protein